jgi:hypothetical protein
MSKLNPTEYYSRVEKLHARVYGLVSAHRKWLASRTGDSLFALKDARVFDQIIAELGMTMHAIETGHIGLVDKTDRDVDEPAQVDLFERTP